MTTVLLRYPFINSSIFIPRHRLEYPRNQLIELYESPPSPPTHTQIRLLTPTLAYLPQPRPISLPLPISPYLPLRHPYPTAVPSRWAMTLLRPAMKR